MAFGLVPRLGPTSVQVFASLDASKQKWSLDLFKMNTWEEIFKGPIMFPESWVSEIIATKEESIQRMLPHCGAVGIESLLKSDVFERASLGLGIISAPDREPKDFLTMVLSVSDDEKARWCRERVTEWWYAPWMRKWAVESRRTLSTNTIIVGITALMAAEGNAESLAWLRADPGRIKILVNGRPQVLNYRPDILPADLAAPLIPKVQQLAETVNKQYGTEKVNERHLVGNYLYALHDLDRIYRNKLKSPHVSLVLANLRLHPDPIIRRLAQER
jgi:hypothetical protein